MMLRQVMTIVISVYLAVIVQGAFASHLTIHLARPDFVTVTIVSLGVLTGFGQGVASGLWGGFLLGALCGGNFGSFMVSRALAGGLMGSLPKDIHRENLLVPLAATLVSTLATEIVYFVMAPVSPVGWWAKITLCQMLYNLVIAIPIYWLIQRSLPRPSGKPAFASQKR